MSEGHKPALRIPERAGRVAAFLVGSGMTVFAVLTMAGIIVWSDGAGEPVHNIFVRVVIGLIFSSWGLAIVGGAIFGFPEASHSRRPRTRRGSGATVIDSGDSGDDFG